MKKLLYLFFALIIFSCESNNENQDIFYLGQNVSKKYKLNQIDNFAGKTDIRGITSDGEYLWILYFDKVGGYYDNNKLNLVKYDYKNDITLRSFELNNEYIVPTGITFDGQNIWIQFDDKIKKIDAINGKELKSFATEYGVSDLTFFNGNIFLSIYYKLILEINPSNGSLIKTMDDPFDDHNSTGAIAIRDNEIWVSHSFDKNIGILDNNANSIGFVDTNSIIKDISYISFMNDNLIICDSNRIYICEIEKLF